MKEDAMFASDGRALLNQLDGAHLVVGVHDADKHPDYAPLRSVDKSRLFF
jgi:hypothetical protein